MNPARPSSAATTSTAPTPGADPLDVTEAGTPPGRNGSAGFVADTGPEGAAEWWRTRGGGASGKITTGLGAPAELVPLATGRGARSDRLAE
jgi:hypothetical protein